LFAAKNFLADEDPDRCLRFDTKITQVEELVAQIEKDNVSCDPGLFRDVKVKLKVHRDWEARRKTSPFDTGCCEAPLIAPFSTRLISAETAASLRQERETQGLVTQMRTDHAPFSVNPEDDHGAFLAKMREDSMTDPNEIDQDTNLLWTESRAYLWAMRDPSMIPFWMHPTNGIPTKGIKAADSRNRLYVPVFDSVKNRRPSRGWIPAHVAATETKINELLSIQAPSSEEFAQLQELLCPFEPIDLHELHKQDESFTEAAILGHLSANQRSAQAQIKARFDNAWRSWVNSLASHGVYFIIRTPGEPEVLDQPGVLYVNDGIMTLEHLDTLEKAQSLLDRLLANGRMDLTEQESASLDSLMQYSLPINILEVQREILRILEVQGANSVSDLDQEYQAKVTDLEKAEQERKLRWEDELKQSGGAEFCYVRPAEMKHNKNIILYLPWDLIAIPQVPVQARPDLQLLPEVQKLQDDVNKDLPRNINLPSIDRGSLQFRKSLEQLVYLDLRDLLTPYFALRQKEAAGPPLTSDEARQYDVLAAAVHHLWEAWWHGLGKKITIKMPRAEQENKPPGVMYCRDPSNKPIGEDLETFFTRKAASVNQILARHASQTSGTEPPEYFSELYVLCRDLQYPALKILEEQYRSAGTEKKSKRLQHDWEVAFKHWIQSKKGHTIQIKMPNPRIDPDDDPSVVYYRGPLLTPSDFPGLSEDIKNRIQTTRTSPVSTFPIGLRSQLPPLLQRLIEAHERWNSPESETILEWHLEAFMNAPTPSKPVSLTLNRSNPHSPTAIALMEVSNDDSHSYLTEMPFLSPVWSQGQPAQLDVDLTALLPEIRAIELEINRLLAMFGGGGMPLYLDKADAVTTVLRHLDDHKRLTILLQQFWPNPVYQRWHRAEQYKKLLRIVGRYGHQISTQEYENTVAACDEAFLIAHNSWLTELRSTGVHIQTSPEEAHPLDKVTLIFQPGTSLKATKTHPEPTFCVLTPETTAGSEVQTSKLVYRSVYDTPPSSTSVNYNALLRAHLAALETRINVLLQKRSSSEWTWDESEVLLGHLRAFMSPFLAELDPKLRSLDEKARREKLTEHETRNWHQMWQDWHRGYGSWLDGLPHDGIVIDKGDQIGSDSGVLKLRIEDSSVLQPISRPKNLPLPLKSREDLMNRLLSDHTARSDKNRWHLDQILASLLRPILQKFRYLVQDHIRLGICKRTGKDSEDDALMEALISLGQTLLMERIFKSEATCRIQILEPVPGDYLINAIDSSGAVIFPVSEMEEVTLAQQLFDQLCPPYLDDSKIMFHDLAFRIRTDIAQNQEDLDFLTQNIPDISTREITTLTARALELLGPFQEQGIDESQVQKELADALARMCWKILMSMHQDQDEKIRNILGNPIIPNQTPVLIARRLPGASPLSPPPLVAPPNEVEIKELEIEINNLLSREKIKTINKEQQQKLNYLLRALLPPRLRFLKNRIDDLDRQYLAKDGLDLRDSLELADAQDQFDPQFEQWKQSISDLGIVLDHWLCTPAAIAEGCSRARQWKKFTTKSDGSTISGDIGVYLEDMNVKQCHDIYDTLRDFVEAGCRSPSEVTDQLQLRVVPQEIINQINQITAQTQLVQACTDPEKTPKAMLWQTMKDQLIKSYVKWLVGLIVSLKIRSAIDSH
jgi:hypothetical protein